MGLDINIKKAKKKRIPHQQGERHWRFPDPGTRRIPESGNSGMVQEIAEKYGNGIVHLTTRQGFEIEGIRWKIWTKSTRCCSPSSTAGH